MSVLTFLVAMSYSPLTASLIFFLLALLERTRRVGETWQGAARAARRGCERSGEARLGGARCAGGGEGGIAGSVHAHRASTMNTRVLLSSIFFIADSVVSGYLMT